MAPQDYTHAGGRTVPGHILVKMGRVPSAELSALVTRTKKLALNSILRVKTIETHKSNCSGKARSQEAI